MNSLFIRHFVRTALGERSALFWPMWITMAAGVAACVFWLLSNAPVPIAAEERVPRREAARARATGWAVALFLVVLGGFIASSLAWEDFAYPDDSMFTLVTLRGTDLMPPIWPNDGRFFPLGHLEYDLVRRLHLTTAPEYHVVPVLELLIVCGILISIDRDIGLRARAVLAAIVLVMPAIVISYGGLIYSESALVSCLCCFLFCFARYRQTWAIQWAIAAMLSAQFMTFYKETAFLLLLGFALAGSVLRCRADDGRGWDWSRLADREGRLLLCSMGLSFLFLVWYLGMMLPHPNIGYAKAKSTPLPLVILAYLNLDPLAWVLSALFVIRSYLILRNRLRSDWFWDAAACGGVLYFVAFLGLRMFSSYYLAPVDVIAVLYVGRNIVLSWPTMKRATRVAVTLFAFAAIGLSVGFSGFRVYEDKNVMHGKAAIASTIKAQFQSDKGQVVRLYFPFSTPYSIMEFAGYLEYRGVPVEGVEDTSGSRRPVELAGAAIGRGGTCVDYRSVLCHADSAPRDGDLVIILPDDAASSADTAPYMNDGKLLLTYHPRPTISGWFAPVLRTFHLSSYQFAGRSLPDRYLQGSVSVWR